MTCHNCRIEMKNHAKYPDGRLRYRCSQYGKTFSEPKQYGVIGHKQIDEDRALLALTLIVEGNSIRSAARVTGLDKKTITKLVVDAGQRCEALLDAKIQNVPVSDVQADEIWGFVGKKEGHKNPFEGDDMYLGEAWCFIGIERHSKLVLCFELGKRTETSAGRFMAKLAAATDPRQRFQLTTDGLPAYPFAVGSHLGNRVDYAQLIKVYAQTPEGERRYSPPEVVSAESKPVSGDPDMQRICTSHIERQLTPVVQAAHAAHLCLQQKVGESPGGVGTTFCVLQLLPSPQFDQGNASDGSGARGLSVDAGRIARRIAISCENKVALSC